MTLQVEATFSLAARRAVCLPTGAVAWPTIFCSRNIAAEQIQRYAARASSANVGSLLVGMRRGSVTSKAKQTLQCPAVHTNPQARTLSRPLVRSVPVTQLTADRPARTPCITAVRVGCSKTQCAAGNVGGKVSS